jgi:hypothetical protein
MDDPGQAGPAGQAVAGKKFGTVSNFAAPTARLLPLKSEIGNCPEFLPPLAGLRSFVADRVPTAGFDAAAPGFFRLAGQGGGDLSQGAAT